MYGYYKSWTEDIQYIYIIYADILYAEVCIHFLGPSV
jgi:hypothetical protein